MNIKLTGVEKRFNQQIVIPAINMTLTSGWLTTLLGPSGCGKTTLLRMIAGLETPDAGEIWFDEDCVFSCGRRTNRPPEKRGLGFVFQDFALWPHLTVFENVAFGLRAEGQTVNLKGNVHNALEMVRLADLAGRYPHQLSGGQQQRVALARAIVIRPKCILFDEPLSALDAVLREEMRTELKNLVAQLKITAVFVTHDQIEAMSMSDEVIVINNGRIEQCGTPEEIYRCPRTAFVARFVGRSNWLGENKMFRPEALSLEPTASSKEYRVKLRSSHFVGNGYELCLEQNNKVWFTHAAKRIERSELSVYLDGNSVVEFA
ncbi:MAG: ABC transporter ATP-binding protein [Deltaproteobacteria bacterium]|nr:ABC transporter ATP-binding protein [Deltaproteobacteria bacterium]